MFSPQVFFYANKRKSDRGSVTVPRVYVRGGAKMVANKLVMINTRTCGKLYWIMSFKVGESRQIDIWLFFVLIRLIRY